MRTRKYFFIPTVIVTAVVVTLTVSVYMPAVADKGADITTDSRSEIIYRNGTYFVKPGIHHLGYSRNGNMLVSIDDHTEVDTVFPGCRRLARGAGPHRQFCKLPTRKPSHNTAPTGPVLGDAAEPGYVPTEFDAAYATAYNLKPKGARLNVQPPKGWAFADVITIFYMTNTTQTQMVDTFMGPATITWRASRHDFSFGDASRLESWFEDGAAYPNHKITHTYTVPKDYYPTVTTVWDTTVNINNKTYLFKGSAFTTETQKLEIWKRKTTPTLTETNHNNR